MIINRVWAMPNKWTFQCYPIKQLLKREIIGTWCDPFAGETSPASVRNDIRIGAMAESHMDGLDFLRMQDGSIFDGVLFDPPYSIEQAMRKYGAGHGGTAGRWEYWAKCKDEIARIVKPNGKAICFGWDSTGIGMKRGFELVEVLLVCHGACHRDTIITIELKRCSQEVMELKI
jgi:hypothetical protein